MKPIFLALKVLSALAMFVVIGQGLPSAHAGMYGGVYFGGIPVESASQRTGCPLRDVRPDSPAAKAGLRAGDLIVQFGETPIKSIDDLRMALGSQRPEEAVRVVYVRGGQRYRTDVTLTASW